MSELFELKYMLFLLVTSLVSFLVVLLTGKPIIRILHQLKFGQSVRDDGPQTHLKKSGTPTMGGILIFLALIAGLLVFRPFSFEVNVVLLATFGYGIIGLIDDAIIIIAKRSLGLKARQKLFLQILLGAAVAFFLSTDPSRTAQYVPFTHFCFDFLAYGFWGTVLFYGYVIFVMVAISNAVNLTDGLDGLASGTVAVALMSFSVLLLAQGYNDLAIFAAALIGACIGFIWFNGPPAQVFMGDTGSLALGGALGTLALFSRTSLFLVIIGGIFVAEALSVIIQVTSYKLTGKRVFRMSPLHHHFELGNMLEYQVVMRFWIVGAVLGVLGVLTFLLMY